MGYSRREYYVFLLLMTLAVVGVESETYILEPLPFFREGSELFCNSSQVPLFSLMFHNTTFVIPSRPLSDVHCLLSHKGTTQRLVFPCTFSPNVIRTRPTLWSVVISFSVRAENTSLEFTNVTLYGVQETPNTRVRLVRSEGDPIFITDEWGNTKAVWKHVQCKPYEVCNLTLTYEVLSWDVDYRPVLFSPHVSPRVNDTYLLESPHVEVTHENIASLVTSFNMHQNAPTITAYTFSAWIQENIAYDSSLSYEESAHTTLVKRRGACSGKSSLFVAMLRARGIPARFVTGLHDGVLHRWAEYYEGGWWIPVDITAQENLPFEHFARLSSHYLSLATTPFPLAPAEWHTLSLDTNVFPTVTYTVKKLDAQNSSFQDDFALLQSIDQLERVKEYYPSLYCQWVALHPHLERWRAVNDNETEEEERALGEKTVSLYMTYTKLQEGELSEVPYDTPTTVQIKNRVKECGSRLHHAREAYRYGNITEAHTLLFTAVSHIVNTPLIVVQSDLDFHKDRPTSSVARTLIANEPISLKDAVLDIFSGGFFSFFPFTVFVAACVLSTIVGGWGIFGLTKLLCEPSQRRKIPQKLVGVFSPTKHFK